MHKVEFLKEYLAERFGNLNRNIFINLPILISMFSMSKQVYDNLLKKNVEIK